MQSELLKEDWYYKNWRDCFRKIHLQEGIYGFYKGAGVNVLRSVSAALALVAYGEFKKVALLKVKDVEVTVA
jgi:hypothetical protein